MVRPGLSIMEVLVSLLLTGLIAGLAASAVTNSRLWHDSLDERRNAMEVAHRVLLQHIDDPKMLEGQRKRTEYKGHMYRFELEEMNVAISGATAEATQTVPITSRLTPLADATTEDRITARMNMVTVRVYHDAEENPHKNPEIMLAELTRFHNPLRDPSRAMRTITELLSNDLDAMQATDP